MGIAPDLFVLFCLILMRIYYVKIGLWHYVKVKKSIHDTPSFKPPYEELSERMRLKKLEHKKNKEHEY